MIKIEDEVTKKILERYPELQKTIGYINVNTLYGRFLSVSIGIDRIDEFDSDFNSFKVYFSIVPLIVDNNEHFKRLNCTKQIILKIFELKQDSFLKFLSNKIDMEIHEFIRDTLIQDYPVLSITFSESKIDS